MENNMEEIVCGCYNVTKSAILKAINEGASSFEEVQAVTHIATGCGECLEEAKKVVEKLLLKQA